MQRLRRNPSPRNELSDRTLSGLVPSASTQKTDHPNSFSRRPQGRAEKSFFTTDLRNITNEESA